jgi:hypothetical protein
MQVYSDVEVKRQTLQEGSTFNCFIYRKNRVRDYGLDPSRPDNGLLSTGNGPLGAIKGDEFRDSLGNY